MVSQEEKFVSFFTNLPIRSLKGILKRYESEGSVAEQYAINMIKEIIKDKKRESKVLASCDS